jgi:methylmalonyl-CoA mutase N-terminal domain/subunit
VVDGRLEVVHDVAASKENLMEPMRDALAAGATIGEVSDALRAVFGVHRPTG